MPVRNIHIQRSNPANHSLTLDLPNLPVNFDDTIHWHIDNNSGVQAIYMIQGKPNAPAIWAAPPAQQGAIFEGRIIPAPPPPTPQINFHYTIFWYADGDTCTLHPYDPILSINPTKKNNSDTGNWLSGKTINSILGLVGIMLSCIILWRMEGMRKKLGKK